MGGLPSTKYVFLPAWNSVDFALTELARLNGCVYFVQCLNLGILWHHGLFLIMGDEWLGGWLGGWQADWLAGWLAGWLAA